jgi:hypothetical protein
VVRGKASLDDCLEIRARKGQESADACTLPKNP